jgi:dipeptidase D
MPSIAQFYFVRAMYAAHNGVYGMSADFDELVETSNNIAKVVLSEESYGTMLDTFFCRKLI